MRTGIDVENGFCKAVALLTLGVTLTASAYEVTVPVGGYRATPENLRCEFDSARKLDSSRIVFVADVMMRDDAKRAEIVERVRQNVVDAKKEGFRETAVWFWSFWCSDPQGFTTMTGSDGWTSGNICCPLDPGFRQVAGKMVRDFASSGVDMILLDDDYRYGNYHDSELVCTCARHLALVEKMLGEKITPADLKRKAMTGGRNRWRDAWMDSNGKAFRDYAAFLRTCVDEVDPNVRLGLCACMSHWDNDGVDAATTARILAGKTRPFLRLIGAPYWASPKGPHYCGGNLQNVIEFERMERSWVRGDDIEVVSEGDTWPRPRWATGSSHLELFDLALRVDGRFDGILKYALDYDNPRCDGGYVARHVKNRPLYSEVARRFDGRTAVGVRIYEEMNRLREAVLDGELAGNTRFLQTFGSEAAKCCSDLAIPTVWEGEGLVGMAFGENVRHVPAEARRRGLIIDAWAARILMRQGIDVGVKAWGEKVLTGVDVAADKLVNYESAYEGYAIELKDGAEILGTRTPGRPPYAFLYRNAAGEKYLVLPFEAYWTKPGWHRTYEAGRLLAEGIRRLAGRPLPAFLSGDPDVMLMAKDGADGSRSVAILNCFSDALVDAPIELDREFSRVEFVNCRGRLEGNRVILDEVPAYAFAAFTVYPKTLAASETFVLSDDGPSTLTAYLPQDCEAPVAAIVICPGGGYRELCDTYEGIDMARWLNARGIAAFVLRYRLAPKWHGKAMLEDIRSALALVRGRSAEWRVDPHRVGVLGFSAGGHLACMAGTLDWSERPDFMALVYPHVSMALGLGLEQMRQAFLGPDYQECDIGRYSGEKLVSEKTPRTFLVHARTDEICSVEHSRRFAAAMRARGRPVDYFELDSGRHGLGCGNGEHWKSWLESFDAWLMRTLRASCTDLTDFVDPFIGTAGTGHTFPGACAPFGMVQASPDCGTESWRYCSGYRHEDDSIYGFSQTHLSGTGGEDLGDVLLLPFCGDVEARGWKERIDKKTETASPGYYAVTLTDSSIRAEVTATEHVAFYRFRYDGEGPARLLYDGQWGIVHEGWMKDYMKSFSFARDGDTGFHGQRQTKSWNLRNVGFDVVFDRPCVSCTKLPQRKSGEKGERYVFEFDLKTGETLLVKVGLAAGDGPGGENGALELPTRAARNLDAEIPGWDFDTVKDAARQKWNEVLGMAVVEGTGEQKKNWYTSLYHLCIQPNNIADVGEKPFYSTFSCWDTFRAAGPLYTILYPEKAAAFVDSMLVQGKRTGYLPIWTLWGTDNQCMVGTHSVPMIVDAWLKGTWPNGVHRGDRDITVEMAYQQIKETLTKTHEGRFKEDWGLYDKYGYYPFDRIKGESVSRTMECAYDDWCAGVMAERIGRKEDAAFFFKRASNWKNVLDPSIGFVRGKDTLGNWREPFDPFAIGHGADLANDFTEGNAFQYSWHVMQDVSGLVAAMGGREAFAAKLDALFSRPPKTKGMGCLVDITGLIGQYVHGNEPSHHVIYFYPQVGRPEKAAERIREVFDKFYLPKPDGLCGNDDCGQMSAWYLFSAMGFYPFNPCGGEYVIGAPQLPKVTLNLSNDKVFAVVAKNLSKENKYVKSVMLNGRTVSDWKIGHADILVGGELVFEMVAEPAESAGGL